MRVRPSLSDFLFVSLLVWLFVSGSGWEVLLADGDTGWHIRTGDFILETRSVPTHDLFSYSRPGEPWFAWEWLADLIFALLHRAWGLKGVVILAGLLICLTALVVFRHMLWRGANIFVSLGVVLLGVGASSIHFLARPHVFTLFLLAVSLWIVDRDRQRPGRAVWLLVPLTALWVNLHGGFAALVACLGLLAGGSALERRWLAAGRYAVLAGACGIASLANPYGVQLHLHMVQYLRSDWIREAVDEFQSPKFRTESLLQFEAILFAALLLAGWLIARKRIADALMVVFWAHQALGSVRHVPVFVVVAAPLVASELSLLWDAWARRCSPRSAPGILSAVARDFAGSFRRTTVWTPLLALGALWLCPAAKWPQDFPRAKFPVEMARTHAALLVESRLFTSDEWADYLIYRGWPRQKVFIDGRSDFYGPATGRQYLRLMQGHPDWEEIVERHRFEAVLIPADWPLGSLLARHTGWRLTARDGQALLFERAAGDSPGQPNVPARVHR